MEIYSKGKIPPRRHGAMLGIGVSSLIIIFVALSISIFSVLTLLTVRQDLNTANHEAAATADYYVADTAATETLYTILNNDALPSGVTVTENAEGTIYSWSQPMNERQDLSCEVLLLQSGGYKIKRWQTVNSNSYVNTESLPVWDGSTIPT